MDADRRVLLEALHRCPVKCVLATTGGGTGAAALLLGIPGGSRTVLEVLVPYQERSLVEFLGCRPVQMCSAATSRQMARRAYERADWLAPGENVLGVGCTASLATDRPKHGDHRFHVTCYSSDHIRTYSLTLRKGERDRGAEEDVLDSVLLNALAEACGLTERVPVNLFSEEIVRREATTPADLVSSLLRGELAAFCAGMDGWLSRDAPRPVALLPGAFNPVHEGHWLLAETASRLLGLPVVFELCVTNVDKPPLPAPEIRRRLRQFTWRMPVWVSRAPLFRDKASLFPGAVFVLGVDTAERLISPRYYHDSEVRMAEAFECLRRQGCRFLVAGRENNAGTYIGLEDLKIPGAYRDLFTAIPKAEFCVRASSTALREQAALTLSNAPSA